MNSCSIIQPAFLPWIGYFEIINKSDNFVFLDNVQYVKRSWVNRNYISQKDKKILISLPVKTKLKYYQKINEVELYDFKTTRKKHLNTFTHVYRRSINFSNYFPFINEIYSNTNSNNLSDFLINSLIKISDLIGINTKFYKASQLNLKSIEPNERIIEICKKLDVKNYFSGPSAKNYIDNKLFANNDIKLSFIKYKEENMYNQYQNKNFLDKMSIIDYIFNNKKILFQGFDIEN